MRHISSQRDERWTLLQGPLVLIVALLLVGGCDSVGTDPDEGTNFDTELVTQSLTSGAVNTGEIDSGQYGEVVEGTQTVLRDQAAYESLWSQLHGDQSTTPDPPTVDFESEIVVAVVLGERPTGGYEVEIDEVLASEEDGEMRVEYTETVPGDACAVMQVQTSPYVLVTVDIQDQPVGPDDEVKFSASEQTRSCG